MQAGYVDQSASRAREILATHAERVKAVVNELLVREVLTANEVDLIMRGEPLPEAENSKNHEPERKEGTEEASAGAV